MEWSIERMEAAAELCAGATPRPWKDGTHVGEPKALTTEASPMDSLLMLDKDGMAVFAREEDCAFTVGARTALPDALEAMAELAVQRDALHDSAALLAHALRYDGDDVPAALAALERVLDPKEGAGPAITTWPQPGDIDAATEQETEALRRRVRDYRLRDDGRDLGAEDTDALITGAWRFAVRPLVLREAHLRTELAKLSAVKVEEVAPVLERFRQAFGVDVPRAPEVLPEDLFETYRTERLNDYTDEEHRAFLAGVSAARREGGIGKAAAHAAVGAEPKPGRCEVCEWPLAETMEKGCVPGNCSYRPAYGSDEHRRIQERRAQLAKALPERIAAARARVDELRERFNAYDVGDRPMSPPAELQRELREAGERLILLENEQRAALRAGGGQ